MQDTNGATWVRVDRHARAQQWFLPTHLNDKQVLTPCRFYRPLELPVDYDQVNTLPDPAWCHKLMENYASTSQNRVRESGPEGPWYHQADLESFGELEIIFEDEDKRAGNQGGGGGMMGGMLGAGCGVRISQMDLLRIMMMQRAQAGRDDDDDS